MLCLSDIQLLVLMIGDYVRAQAPVVEANPKDQVWQGLSLWLND